MKHLPNLLTALRFPLAAGLLLTAPLSPSFFALYLLCGASDGLDGFLARRLGVCSAFGARLDSAADLWMFALLLYTLWPLLAPTAGFAGWIAAVALCRFAAALAARLRFGRFGFLHTYGNKLTGALLALCPFALLLFPGRWMLIGTLIAASASAAEELALELTADAWDPNQKGFLFK